MNKCTHNWCENPKIKDSNHCKEHTVDCSNCSGHHCNCNNKIRVYK